tara:strand:- start:707 stop:1228 length:522 start_codon:yes stop_codon:yes gene_type:complete
MARPRLRLTGACLLLLRPAAAQEDYPPNPPMAPPTLALFAVLPTEGGISSVDNCTAEIEGDWDQYAIESKIFDPFCSRTGADCSDTCRKVGSLKADCLAEPELKVYGVHTKIGFCNSCYNESIKENKTLGHHCREGKLEPCVRRAALLESRRPASDPSRPLPPPPLSRRCAAC